MTPEERLKKFKQAQALIREVEFSYPHGHDTRSTIYGLIVNSFGMMSTGALVEKLLRKEIKDAEQAAFEARQCATCNGEGEYAQVSNGCPVPQTCHVCNGTGMKEQAV